METFINTVINLLQHFYCTLKSHCVNDIGSLSRQYADKTAPGKQLKQKERNSMRLARRGLPIIELH